MNFHTKELKMTNFCLSVHWCTCNDLNAWQKTNLTNTDSFIQDNIEYTKNNRLAQSSPSTMTAFSIGAYKSRTMVKYPSTTGLGTPPISQWVEYMKLRKTETGWGWQRQDTVNLQKVEFAMTGKYWIVGRQQQSSSTGAQLVWDDVNL